MPHKAKIAIIEDEPAIQQLYKLKFELAGYDVRAAGDGQSGLVLLAAFMPDLVLLDLKMPIMSGDEMLQRLRAEEWGNSMRVIILTNISKNEAPHSLRLLNVDRYIVKAHYTPNEVLEVAEEVLQNR